MRADHFFIRTILVTEPEQICLSARSLTKYSTLKDLLACWSINSVGANVKVDELL